MQTSLKFLLLFSFAISSCATKDQKQETKSETHIFSIDTAQKIDAIQKQFASKKLSSESDTLTINTKSAVFYQPDSLQIEKRMKESGEEAFRAGADDYVYHVNTSANYLEKQGLPVIESKNKKYIQFIMKDKKVKLIKLDTLPELWGMYLFDPMKMPHYADITLIERDYKSYFK